MELLVGRVQIVVGQAEAHHHTGNLQRVLKMRDMGIDPPLRKTVSFLKMSCSASVAASMYLLLLSSIDPVPHDGAVRGIGGLSENGRTSDQL